MGHSVDVLMGAQQTVCSGWCPQGEVTTPTHNRAPPRSSPLAPDMTDGTAGKDVEQGRVLDSSPVVPLSRISCAPLACSADVIVTL